jgi:hypothetical protein
MIFLLYNKNLLARDIWPNSGQPIKFEIFGQILSMVNWPDQILKKRVYEMFPEIAADKSEPEHARQKLESALQAAWDTLDKKSFDVWYQSMPSRIEACIAADGRHTKYWSQNEGVFRIFWREL